MGWSKPVLYSNHVTSFIQVLHEVCSKTKLDIIKSLKVKQNGCFCLIWKSKEQKLASIQAWIAQLVAHQLGTQRWYYLGFKCQQERELILEFELIFTKISNNNYMQLLENKQSSVETLSHIWRGYVQMQYMKADHRRSP